MPNNRNVSYAQDFRPFPPFRAPLGVQSGIAGFRTTLGEERGRLAIHNNCWYSLTVPAPADGRPVRAGL